MEVDIQRPFPVMVFELCPYELFSVLEKTGFGTFI
jgi:hypothetical protein